MRGVSGGSGHTSEADGAGFFFSAAVTVVRSATTVSTTIDAKTRAARRLIRSSTSKGVAADAQRARASRAESQQPGAGAMRVVAARAAQRPARFRRIAPPVNRMSDRRMSGGERFVEGNMRRRGDQAIEPVDLRRGEQRAGVDNRTAAGAVAVTCEADDVRRRLHLRRMRTGVRVVADAAGGGGRRMRMRQGERLGDV